MCYLLNMKTLLVLFVISIILSSGCGAFNPNDIILPDDLEFIQTVKILNTPEKISNYMQDNFAYKENFYSDPDPYVLWLSREGDCDDMSTFATTCATYHGIPVYQIHLYFKGICICHSLAVYLENDKYTYSSNQNYFPVYVSSFDDIVLDYFKSDGREIIYYNIYDYQNNLIEKVQK